MPSGQTFELRRVNIDVYKESYRRTRRRYAGVKVDSTSVSGSGEKQLGLDSAALAIITECAP